MFNCLANITCANIILPPRPVLKIFIREVLHKRIQFV